MARTITDIDVEIAKYNSYKNEWIKPLNISGISNRFTEAIIDGLVKDRLDTPDNWETYDNFLLGNINQFCIFELGDYSISDSSDVIRNVYEIGNESEKTYGVDENAVNKPKYWELSLFENRGVASSRFTDDIHLTPYYPDDIAKYASYAKITTTEVGDGGTPELFHKESVVDIYQNELSDEFIDCYLDIFDEEILATHNSTNIASLIPDLSVTDLGGQSTLGELVEPSGYDSQIREEIYTGYCEEMSWWADDTGEVAEWHNGDQGIYTGKFKIVSSWQIYEWILGEIDELEREKTSLLSRTQQEIDNGVSEKNFIENAGLKSAFDSMFTEYPGIFTSVKIKYGFYIFTGDEILNNENDLFSKYGYKNLESIKTAFTSNNFTSGASATVMQSYFSPSETIDVSSGTYNGSITIYKLRYNDFFNASAKHRFFILAYSLGLTVDWDEPCPWDGLIVFIVAVIITWFMGPKAGTKTITSFKVYLALFSSYLSIGLLWAGILGIGSQDDLRKLGYLAMSTGLWSSWLNRGEMINNIMTEASKVGKDITIDSAESLFMHDIAFETFISVMKIAMNEKSSTVNEDSYDFIEENESRESRISRQKKEDNFQFEPLERLLQKQRLSHDKINKQDLYDYRLKEMYG